MINSHESRIKQLNAHNKILLVGLANAGKTSIYVRCFENADHERIRNLTPTILFTSKQPKMGFSEEFIEFFDLGGQKQYIKHHLSDSSRFRSLRTVIFVVDVQDISKLEDTKLYFSNILAKIQDNKEDPTMAVFLHKADPKLKPELQNNIVRYIKELQPLFPSGIFFHVTTVFDESVYEAMIQTLFLSLPKSVIKQTISRDVLFTAHKTLLPIFKSLHGTAAGDPTTQRETLIAFAIPFGNALGKKLQDKWIRYIATVEPPKADIHPSEESIGIQSESNGLLVETHCPLLLADEEIELHPFYCEITKGILEGLAILIGFDFVTLLQTQIRDKTSICKFLLNRKLP